MTMKINGENSKYTKTHAFCTNKCNHKIFPMSKQNFQCFPSAKSKKPNSPVMPVAPASVLASRYATTTREF